MTREEKIAELINIRDHFNYTLAPREVFDDAIKSLEQEPTIQERQAESDRWQKAFDDGYQNGYSQASFDCRQDLDKIRAEIADLDDADYDYEGYYKAVTDALKIIDKYKADKEAE